MSNNKSGSSNDYKSLRTDRKTIAAIASATVDGYLRNASRRHRVPTAEGGRGTRRKLAMVTSATVAEEAGSKEIVDADDEWDEVDLPAVPVKKQELLKQDEAATSNDLSTSGVKGERNANCGLPVVKDEVPLSAPFVPPAANGAKTETIVIEADPASATSLLNPFNVDDTPLPQGARPPLMEQPQRTAWRQRSDPAYEAMREQMDLVAAQRRSERISRTCSSIVTLISLLERGRLLWREAHHPKFLKALLALERRCDGGSVAEVVTDLPKRKQAKTEVPASTARTKAASKRNHVLLPAVKRSKELTREASQSENSKPSLAPAWVTITRDTVKNKTSEAVTVLLKAINDVFELQVPGTDEGLVAPENSPTAGSADGTMSVAAAAMADWAARIQPQFLSHALRDHRILPTDDAEKIALPHTLYFSVIFLALAAMAKMDARLVIAKQVDKNGSPRNEEEQAGNNRGKTAARTEVDSEAAPRPEKMSIFLIEPKKRARKAAAATGAVNNKDDDDPKEGEQVKSKKQPSSCFWVEVWSAERGSFVAVNPCAGCTTLWGAPYTFSIAGDIIVDATARYTSKYSTAFSYNRRLGRVSAFGFLWKDKLRWDDNREISEVLLESFCKDATAKTRARLPREQKQLESLAYSEPVPTTLSALHRHPLFVIESDLARHEGVHPKNAATTVGRVKGHTVYKRSAVVNLRSRDGWLREGRSLTDEDVPAFKQVPPPASRPFAAPSAFYGLWQTKAFAPLPLREDGSIPHHGRTTWYILLNAEPPKGIVHLTQPQIARVARRMQLDFGLAVVGFNKRRIEENRRGHWEAVIDGIAVRETDEKRLLKAYKEWMQMVQEQEAAKRRDRAMHWWQLFIQRSLATARLRALYLDGAAQGSLPAL